MFWKIVRDGLRTARVRLTLLFAALFTALAATVFILVYWDLSSTLISRVDGMLRDDVDEMIGVYRRRGLDAVRTYCKDETADEGSQNIFYRFQSPRGDLSASFNPSALKDIEDLGGAQQPSATNSTFTTLAVPGETHHVRVISALLPGGEMLQVGRSLKYEEDLIKEYAKVFLQAFSVLLVSGVFLGWLITHKTTAGVRRMAFAADHIRLEGDFSLRVATHNECIEIEQLARAFNGMLDRIQALVAELKEVTDNIAHDLRSPVTRMRGVAETTLTGSQHIDDYRDMAGVIVEECDRLVCLINTMLEIAETEAGTAHISLADIDIAALAKDAHDLFGPVAEDKGLRLLFDAATPVAHVRGDARRLQRVLANLLDNAIKYTPSGGTVTVGVVRAPGAVHVVVSDTGCGIAPNDMPRIFDRYYRADPSRSTEGSGLGLSLARALAHALGGDITVASTLGTGSVFTLVMPAA